MPDASPTASRLKNRRSRGKPPGPWVTARKVVQYLALLAFIVLFILSQSGGLPGSLANIPMRLDPLIGLSHLLSSRVFLASSALALIVLILSLVFGRAWCGWLCPLGTVLDIFSLKRWRGKRPAPPEAWRGVKYALLLMILVAALFSNLTLLVLDPLTLLFRTLTVSIWPALDRVVRNIEVMVYKIPFLSGPVASFDGAVRPTILSSEPAFYRDTVLFALIFVGVILLNIFAQRFWCRYLCPLGGLLGLVSKAAIFRRQVGEECRGCVLCTQVCPTGTIDPHREYASDPSECTLCMECLETCPRSTVAFKPGISLAKWREYDPNRRQALVAIGSAVAGLALFRSNALAKRQTPHWIQPPGGRENDLLIRCVRCAECVRVCPTSGLQPAVMEAGWEGIWTPVLVPRLGYCDYSCNACGQVCPVQAIPPLTLEEKRQQVIGSAYIDQNRCLAWSDHQPCIVCEEMCPLPKKAIYLEESQALDMKGNLITLQLPQVDRKHCIGCGICEYKCPVTGEAAIRVYVPTAEV
jgi:polyferredoxin